MFNDDGAPISYPMNYPNNRTTTPDQLAVNHEVLNDDIYNTPVNLPCAADMISMSLQVPVPDYGFATPRHPTVWRYSHPQGQFLSNSVPEVDLVWTRPLNFLCSTTTDVSGCESGHNPPTLHSTEYYDPMLGCISVGHPSPPTGGSSSHILPIQYLDHYASHFPLSSQYSVTKQNMPLVSRYALPLYNDSPHQWQNFATPQPGLPSLQLPLMGPAALTVGSSQFHSSHPVHISPPPNRLSPIPIRFYDNSPPHLGQRYRVSAERHPDPSPPLLISCRWLLDDMPCGFAGPLEALSTHCKSSHFSGPKNAQIECRWEGCDYRKRDDPTVHVMRRDCIWRHTYEIHLGMKRGT